MNDTELVEGKSYTSNTTKLLKHMDKLKLIQDKKPSSPVMAHISLINACNLTCSFCCFANRKMTDKLSLQRVKLALDSFKKIGVKGIEFTGGGEPTLHPDFEEITQYAYGLGFSLGLCTNGATLGKSVKKETIKLFSWVRLGMYGFYENYEYDLEVFHGLDTKISAAHVWDEELETSSNPNTTGEWTDKSKKKLSTNSQTNVSFYKMLDWVEENKIPTRIAFNAIKNADQVEKDIETIKRSLESYNEIKGKKCQYAFISDFNYKSKRRNNNCYIHMVKPFLFTDGFVYACPSAELSLENNYNYVPESQFMVCSIEEIENFYSNPLEKREHACVYCKYSMQNELIDDILTETEDNDFA